MIGPIVPVDDVWDVVVSVGEVWVVIVDLVMDVAPSGAGVCMSSTLQAELRCRQASSDAALGARPDWGQA